MLNKITIKNFKTLFWITFVFCLMQVFQVSHAWFKKSPYTKVFKAHTRSDELYQRPDFYASVTWSATLMDDDFLKALMDEIGRVYADSPHEKRAYYRDNLASFEKSTVFFLSFYAYDRNSVDLTQKYPSWKIRLLVNGKRHDPVHVEKIGKPDVLQTFLFPYIKPWANHYYLHFPRLDLSGHDRIVLTVDGPHAHGKLTWK